MAEFALALNYEGDYGMKLLMVDTTNTMEEVVRIASENLVGVLVPPPPPGTLMRIRRHGQSEPLPPQMTIAEAGFISMETVDVYQTR